MRVCAAGTVPAANGCVRGAAAGRRVRSENVHSVNRRADPQIFPIVREMAVDVEHPTLGRMKSLGSAIKMSGTPTNPRRRAPMLGEHTEAVLQEYGFSAEEIASLRAEGAVA